MMPYTQTTGGAMDIAADTGMVGAAGAAVIVAEAAGVSSELDFLLAGVVAALVRIIVPELFALLRARLILWRQKTEAQIEEITAEPEPDSKHSCPVCAHRWLSPERGTACPSCFAGLPTKDLDDATE